MGAGERIVSQKGFGSPELLASEIVEHLLAQLVTSDLIELLRPELGRQGGGSVEEQAPRIVAAVKKLAGNDDVDLLALAKDPKGVDVAELEGKLKARAEAHESAGRKNAEPDLKASAAYWCHLGALVFLQDTRKALAAFEKAVALDPREPEGWRGLGGIHYRLGDLSAAERDFERLLELGLASGDVRTQAIARLRLGWIFADRGPLAKAIGFFEEALRLSDRIRWEEGVARACGNLGLVYFDQGDLVKAEDMQLVALKHFTELNLKEGMAATYGNLGNICEKRGDLAKAEAMHLEELNLNRELLRKHGIANAYAGLGRVHFARGDLAEAERLQLEALKLEEGLGRKQAIARANGSLAAIYQKMSDNQRMCECWRKSRDLYREMVLTDKASEVDRLMRAAGCGDT
jgi:tetratricopeptide (TPR) repeat protein